MSFTKLIAWMGWDGCRAAYCDKNAQMVRVNDAVDAWLLIMMIKDNGHPNQLNKVWDCCFKKFGGRGGTKSSFLVGWVWGRVNVDVHPQEWVWRWFCPNSHTLAYEDVVVDDENEIMMMFKNTLSWREWVGGWFVRTRLDSHLVGDGPRHPPLQPLCLFQGGRKINANWTWWRWMLVCCRWFRNMRERWYSDLDDSSTVAPKVQVRPSQARLEKE